MIRILEFNHLYTLVFLYISMNGDYNVINSKHVYISYIWEMNFCSSVNQRCQFIHINALTLNMHLNTK